MRARRVFLGVLIGGLVAAVSPLRTTADSVYFVIDTPKPNASVEPNWFLGGWSLRCSDAAPPDRVDVRFTDDTGRFVDAPGLLIVRLHRPDVSAAAASTCRSAATADTGFHRYFTTPIPPGRRDVVIDILTGGQAVHQHLRLDILGRAESPGR